MIPRLGDGNFAPFLRYYVFLRCLENDSPSRGRKRNTTFVTTKPQTVGLENDSPSRGRKQFEVCVTLNL